MVTRVHRAADRLVRIRRKLRGIDTWQPGAVFLALIRDLDQVNKSRRVMDGCCEEKGGRCVGLLLCPFHISKASFGLCITFIAMLIAQPPSVPFSLRVSMNPLLAIASRVTNRTYPSHTSRLSMPSR